MINRDLIKKAKKAYERKEYRQAAEMFFSVAEEIAAGEDELMKAEMKNNCSVAWLLAGEAQKALDIVLDTDLVFEQAPDPHRQAMALGNQAAALEALGQIPAALNRYQQASEILKVVDDQDLRAYVLQNIAALQLRSGDQLQSIATMHAALENKKKLSVKERFLKKMLRIPFKMMR